MRFDQRSDKTRFSTCMIQSQWWKLTANHYRLARAYLLLDTLIFCWFPSFFFAKRYRLAPAYLFLDTLYSFGYPHFSLYIRFTPLFRFIFSLFSTLFLYIFLSECSHFVHIGHVYLVTTAGSFRDPVNARQSNNHLAHHLSLSPLPRDELVVSRYQPLSPGTVHALPFRVAGWISVTSAPRRLSFLSTPAKVFAAHVLTFLNLQNQTFPGKFKGICRELKWFISSRPNHDLPLDGRGAAATPLLLVYFRVSFRLPRVGVLDCVYREVHLATTGSIHSGPLINCDIPPVNRSIDQTRRHDTCSHSESSQSPQDSQALVRPESQNPSGGMDNYFICKYLR